MLLLLSFACVKAKAQFKAISKALIHAKFNKGAKGNLGGEFNLIRSVIEIKNNKARRKIRIVNNARWP